MSSLTEIKATVMQRTALEQYLTNGGDKVAAYKRARGNSIGLANTNEKRIRGAAYKFFGTVTMKRLMAEADFQAKLQMERKALIGLDTAVETYGITKERIMGELAKIAFAQQTDVCSWGPDGVQLKPSDQLGDAAAAISEVSGGGEAPVKVKLHDKQQALIALGRELGMFSQKVEHKGVVAAAVKFVIER